MATVFREIERKFDPAGAAGALDAVKSMVGVAGVAAVSQRDEEILDAVYYDTEDLRLIRGTGSQIDAASISQSGALTRSVTAESW